MGCGNRLYEQPKDQYPFEIKMKALLGSDLDVVYSINKVEVQNSSVDLPKKYHNLERVINLLEKDGWVLKGKGIGIDTFCLGMNNRVNIINPLWGDSYDFKGRRLNINKYDIDVISYSYDK